MKTKSDTIVAVLDDLFFMVKIQDAAKRAGGNAVFVKTAEAALQSLSDPKALMVIDLNCASIDPVDLVKQVKASKYDVPVVGFVSHVQTDLRQRAVDAGYDLVVARSAFSDKLSDILRRHMD